MHPRAIDEAAGEHGVEAVTPLPIRPGAAPAEEAGIGIGIRIGIGIGIGLPGFQHRLHARPPAFLQHPATQDDAWAARRAARQVVVALLEEGAG